MKTEKVEYMHHDNMLITVLKWSIMLSAGVPYIWIIIKFQLVDGTICFKDFCSINKDENLIRENETFIEFASYR